MTTPASTDLTGKIALVPGAAQGIGAAAAVALAAFGADLAICDRQDMSETLAAIKACGRRGESEVLDVRDGPSVADWSKKIASQYSRVDILVNNAGGGFYSSFLDTSAKGQQALVDENFSSVTHFVREFTSLMPAGSTIINVTSIEASRAAPGFGIYAAMKAAVESLTKTLALELAPQGIRVNALAPDAIPTPGDESLGDAATQGAREAYDRKIPLGWGNIDDASGPIIFLASDLSRFVTGTILHVDGGSHAASGWSRRDDGTYSP